MGIVIDFICLVFLITLGNKNNPPNKDTNIK